jgi:Tfp pilus assembly protein PilX
VVVRVAVVAVTKQEQRVAQEHQDKVTLAVRLLVLLLVGLLAVAVVQAQ